MTNITIHILAVTATLATGSLPAHAECYADYKAKKASPLQLHYGVIKLPDAACSSNSKAKANIQSRIKVGGWNILNVISVFDSSGLAQRKQSAGSYYLKF